MARLLVLYEQPDDPAHFADYFRNRHMLLVRALPGLRSSSFGPAAQVGEVPKDFFWIWEGVYDSVEAIVKSHGSPEGKAVMEDIPNFSPKMPVQVSLDGSES